ncbi:MAG: hypothetical protein V4650_02195 [Pseudomonadota bacterium]
MTSIEQVFEMNKPTVAFQVMDGETVLINFDTGSYFSINEPGTRVVAALENRASLKQLLGDAADEAMLLEFLKCLLDEGVIRFAAGARDAATDPVTPLRFASGETPALQSFSDLQDLLVLDPIHDVAASGWPNLPTAAQ